MLGWSQIGSDWRQMGQIWDRTFKDQFEYIFGRCPILKSPRFVTFDAHLILLGTYPDIPTRKGQGVFKCTQRFNHQSAATDATCNYKLNQSNTFTSSL